MVAATRTYERTGWKSTRPKTKEPKKLPAKKPRWKRKAQQRKSVAFIRSCLLCGVCAAVQLILLGGSGKQDPLSPPSDAANPFESGVGESEPSVPSSMPEKERHMKLVVLSVFVQAAHQGKVHACKGC